MWGMGDKLLARPIATTASGLKSRQPLNAFINGRLEVGFNEVKKTFLDGKFTTWAAQSAREL